MILFGLGLIARHLHYFLHFARYGYGKAGHLNFNSSLDKQLSAGFKRGAGGDDIID